MTIDTDASCTHWPLRTVAHVAHETMKVFLLIHGLWRAQILSACYHLASQSGLDSDCHRRIVANHAAQKKEEIDDVFRERTIFWHPSQGPCQQNVVNAFFRSFEAIDT